MPSILTQTAIRLSDLLKKQVESVDRRELIAEIYDFIAMLEGSKPLLLHGRGLAPPSWIKEVLKFSNDLGLHVIKGPFWDATKYEEFPAWYTNCCRKELTSYGAWYICKETTVAEAVAKVNDAAGLLSIAEEARLMGYPECCVDAHYIRARLYHQGTLTILNRLAKGDETQMVNLFAKKVHLTPVTEQEVDYFDAAFDIQEPKLGSWNICRACERDSDSISDKLSQKYYVAGLKAGLEIV